MYLYDKDVLVLEATLITCIFMTKKFWFCKVSYLNVSILDWRIQTKNYLMNGGAGNLVFYIKIINSVALLFGDLFEKCLRWGGQYPDQQLIYPFKEWNCNFSSLTKIMLTRFRMIIGSCEMICGGGDEIYRQWKMT